MPGVTPSPPRLRPELIDIRQRLADAHAAVREQHDRGLAGSQVCGRISAAADAAVQRLFESALADLPGGRGERLRSRCVLVAHGGYGRRQMAPRSDVDLMILHDPAARADAETLARRLTQDIFDAGLQLGQSLRTVGEAVTLAKADPVICTSLIESRPVAGGQELYEDYAEAFLKAVQKRPRAASAAFIEARRAEREKYGETVYLLEPNIKRSRGGLRDLHLLRWLWFVHAGVSDLDRLRRKGVLSRFDHRRLTSSREFLLRVRNDTHFHAGECHDTLHRGEQVRLAEKLGYRGGDGIRPVEQFMRDYFRHAGHVWFLAARVSELSSPPRAVTTVLGAVLGRSIEKDYRLDGREITATPIGRGKLTRRLDEALRLVDLARLSDRRISQDTWYLVYRSAPNYSAAPAPAVSERFLDILQNPAQLGGLLRRLHDLGVLEKVIPEFTHARCLLQFNQYHKFTVDEHCIRAVEEATRFADRDDLLGQVYGGLRGKRQLHLALLMHDLGKGHEQDHSVLGEAIARSNGRRLGLAEPEVRQLEFLIRRHLWMSHLAFRRDMGDAELVADFAQQVGSLETLQMLFVLTCADLAAVGPGVLNAWKVSVLSDLYAKAAEALGPDARLQVRDRRNAVRTAVWSLLPARQRDDTQTKLLFHELPESFVTSRPPGEVLDAVQRLLALRGGAADAWGAWRPESGTLELIAGVSDGIGRGIFSSMAGALSAAGLQIVAAETTALPGDRLMLRYVAADPSAAGQAGHGPSAGEGKQAPEADPQRVAELCLTMLAAIDDPAPPRFPRVWGADQRAAEDALTSTPSEVRIDAGLSDQWLIVEVFANDRRGLLYELARTLHELRLVIRFAKIA
ncbi:MAG: DUF294 nucleotidyltransferase-like domain-containing protein, partial [Planctomycetota bacterium]